MCTFCQSEKVYFAVMVCLKNSRIGKYKESHKGGAGKDLEREEGDVLDLLRKSSSSSSGGGGSRSLPSNKPRLRNKFPETWIWTSVASGYA